MKSSFESSTLEAQPVSSRIETDGFLRITRIDNINTAGSFGKATGAAALAALKEAASEIAGHSLEFSFFAWRAISMTHGERALDYRASSGKVSQEAIIQAGPAVEFGGPTERKDRIEGPNMLPGYKPDVTTNITRRPKGLDPAQIHALADVTQMPLSDDSVGSVHVSALDRGLGENGIPDDHIRLGAITEAARVLKPGGYLVWDHGTIHDHEAALEHGLLPRALSLNVGMIQLNQETFTKPYFAISGIYQKP